MRMKLRWKKKILFDCIQLQVVSKHEEKSVYCIHLIDKTLLDAKYKPWTMRHDGILGRQHWQACCSVPYIDIEDIFIPKKVLE